MTRTYYRPLGLCYGSDAERLIASHRAGRLGGHSAIGYTLVELIRRDGKSIDRDIIPYTNALQAIETPRGGFAGLAMDVPAIMGIVNVTPDSFSDGGQHSTSEAGVSHGLALAADGADILDVGGESTRPGSDAVAVEEELSRVIPVVRRLSDAGHVVSVDTRKPAVMREAVTAQLMRVEIVPPEQQPELPPMEAHKLDPNTGEDEMAYANAALAAPGVVPAAQRDPNNPETWGKVGRNEACPCGSGKKFKHCHGRYA